MSVVVTDLLDGLEFSTSSTCVNTCDASPISGWCVWKKTNGRGFTITHVGVGESPMSSLVRSGKVDFERLSNDVWESHMAAQTSIEMYRLARELHEV